MATKEEIITHDLNLCLSFGVYASEVVVLSCSIPRSSAQPMVDDLVDKISAELAQFFVRVAEGKGVTVKYRKEKDMLP